MKEGSFLNRPKKFAFSVLSKLGLMQVVQERPLAESYSSCQSKVSLRGPQQAIKGNAKLGIHKHNAMKSGPLISGTLSNFCEAFISKGVNCPSQQKILWLRK